MNQATRLLIAEDDKALAALLQEYLSEGQYVVDMYHRGDEALACLQEQSYDLILTDIVMPGADGLTLLNTVRSQNVDTLVILMTGYSGIEDALHAVEQGAYDFVSKPFQLPEIRVRLDNAARYQKLLRRWDEHQSSKVAPSIPDLIEAKNMERNRRPLQVAKQAYGLPGS